MNKHILKDYKVVVGFILSLTLNFFAIIFAANDNNVWALFLIGGLILSSFSMNRAAKLAAHMK